MGKKHKKESKKRKHRSKSRSRSRSNERDLEKDKRRHHKKHHKERKKEKCVKRLRSDISSGSDDDVEFVPNVPVPPKISKGSLPSPPPPPNISSSSSPPPPPPAPHPATTAAAASHKTERPRDSLSIADTNALRAKLGLKPLQIGSDHKPPSPQQPGAAAATTNGSSHQPTTLQPGGVNMGDFIHKPAEDLSSKKMTEKLRAKLAERKEKRLIEKKLKAVKGLGEEYGVGEGDDDDDALAWVAKNRKLDTEKKLAEKKAKELDEMDEEFGIGELVQEELTKEKSRVYTSTDLRGLTVEHDIDQFEEGRCVVLTLKDKGVLEEDDDKLINVNILDDERHKKNVKNKKQKPYHYSGIDLDAMETDESDKTVLSKYDEEIGGEKKNYFKLGQGGNAIKKETVKEKLEARAKMRLESLKLPELKVASDYYSEEEMKAKFKKPKKLKKVRKKVKADDLLAITSGVSDNREEAPNNVETNNGLPAKTDNDVIVKEEAQQFDDRDENSDNEVMEIVDSENVKLEYAEEDTELELALKKARRLKQLEIKQEPTSFLRSDIIKKEVDERTNAGWCTTEVASGEDAGGSGSGNIVLNSTAEFCRTLGDIPTYGLSGNRDEEAQALLDFESEMKDKTKKQEDGNDRGGWNDVEMDDKLVDIRQVEAPILDAEPDVGAGVAGALRLAISKGYLEKETTNRPSAPRFAHLQAQNYSIEDKAHANQSESREDDKFGRRERYMGPTSEFKEKDSYKPNIKLEYIDDDGHILSAKEAFRYLSHKFHGKGPGKNKVEKRMKKGEQQVLMKQMSSTDTPLGTLQMLQQKQKETQSAFVVLSGTKQMSTPTISKPKLAK